jgi:hypothetical protein
MCREIRIEARMIVGVLREQRPPSLFERPDLAVVARSGLR